MSWRRVAPWLWLLFVLGIAQHQVRFWQQGRIDTDLLTLLPADERRHGNEQALRQLADAASRRLFVLVGAPEWSQAKGAAQRLDAEWRARDPKLDSVEDLDAAAAEQAVQALRPWRDRLLVDDQIALLRDASPEALSARALSLLHQPGPASRLSDWAGDPLGLWPRWWAARAASHPLQAREGWLTLQADSLHWIVVARRSREGAFSMSGNRPHGQALDAAEQAVRAADPGVQVLRAGVPLHAEAAAAQGTAEVNLIGWVSLIGVLALVWAGFRSLRPMACVALSLLVGVAVALSVTAWCSTACT